MSHSTESSPHGASVGPLAGVTVIDMTTSYAGPTGSMYLADLGARVIKIERPVHGDDARFWGPPFVDGTSAWFASANRNKESIALNIRTPQGRAILDRLLVHADVFIENLNPDKLSALRLDPDTLRTEHPHLIYCALSGFGLTGPDNALPGYDLVAQARSGLMSVTGAKGGSPQRVSTALSDIASGMSCALAISAALVKQKTTGEGDVVDVALLESDLALMAPRIASFLAGEAEPAPSGGTDSVLAVYQTFPTADRDIAIAIGNDLMWKRFCAVAGLPELAEDPDLADNAGRRGRRSEVTQAVADKLTSRTAAEWLKLLADADVPASAVQTLSEVVEDPQVIARGSLLPLTGTPGLFGVRSPFRLASLPDQPNRGVPALGEHTRTILLSVGCTDDEIDDFVTSGAVHEQVEIG